MSEDEKIETHPSFGMISFGHVSGQAYLFGSEFAHHHFVSLKITHGQRHRDLSNDWYYGRNEIIEVWLSEAQFCQLVARPNDASGTPCTLRHIQGDQLPDPPKPDAMKDRFVADISDYAAKCVADLRDATAALNAAIDAGTIGKSVLREISKKLQYAARAVDTGMPFVERQFAEAIETTVSHARVEIESHIYQTASRLGLKMMQESDAPFRMIAAAKEKDDVQTTDPQIED